MENNNFVAQNQVYQNPNNVLYETSYPQNQAPFYYPSADTPFPPPAVMTVTLSLVPNPDPGHQYPAPNVSWGAAYGQPGAEAPYSAGVMLPAAAIQVQSRNEVQISPKKTTVMQSLRCEVCDIACNSKDVLENHRRGKKHKKKLDRLRGPPPVPTVAPTMEPTALAIAPVAPAIAISSPIPIIAPLEKPDEATSTKSKKKKAAASLDLESKRRKVLEGGAAPDAICECEDCNVVCNSYAVFSSHLAGQKHAANVKKQKLLARDGAV